MSPVLASIIVTISLFIGGIFMTIIGYFLKQLVDQLKELNHTVSGMKSELSVLVNDHDNLKEDVKDIDVRLKKVELV